MIGKETVKPLEIIIGCKKAGIDRFCRDCDELHYCMPLMKKTPPFQPVFISWEACDKCHQPKHLCREG